MSAYDRPLGEVKLLTVAEVAAIMRLSKMTVYRMVNSGQLPALKVGRSVRIPEHVVDEYLRNSYVDSA
jgi:excisionase family DNA binding protein